MKKNTILIYRLGSLGDTIIALPCFIKIKEVFPESDIVILTNAPISSSAAPLASVLSSSLFNKIISYPVGIRNPIYIFKLIIKIYNLKIDTLFYLPEARSRLSVKRDILFFRLLGIKNIVGAPTLKNDFEIQNDSQENHLFEWEAKRLERRISTYVGEINLDDPRYWNLFLTKEEDQMALHHLGSINQSPLLIISTGTKFKTNDWGLDNWKNLLILLKNKLKGWKLIILGANDDKSNGDECLKIWGDGKNLCGVTELRVSASILKKGTLFIGHDSGPLHLASCVGTPSIGIYSGRNRPGQWYPKKGKSKIIYHTTNCSGCGLSDCEFEKKKCILSITPQEVINEVELLLQQV